MAEENKQPLLSVKNLRINFSTDHGYVQAVRGVSFDLYKGETLCIVGESGSGKSVTNKAIMGILAANGRIVEGSIMYEGEDLTKVSEDEFHRIRGHKIGMIFQDPLSSLNPIMRIGKQITEAMLINASRTKKMYNDLVVDELVEYKNAKTELKTGLAKYKENVKFLKSEKKKQINQAKNRVSNEIEGRKYSLKRELGAGKFAINDKYNTLVEQAKDNIEEIARLEAERKEALAKINAENNVKINEAFADKAELKAEAEAKVLELTEKFDSEIAELKQEAKKTVVELKAKYKPIIKETKAKYRAKSKVAKAEVKKFKKSLKDKYHQEIKDIFAKIKGSDAKLSVKSKRLRIELKGAHDRYVSSLRITKAEAKAKALKIMEEVGIKDPEKRFRQYPFEFSGGMRQRIVIAIALTADPDILICDEPTTALDVTIQAQILELINNLKKERQLSCIFITHDLGVVANMADRVAVMYAGKIVEYGTEEEIFYDPKHPYTWALLSSIPDVDSNEKLEAIPGTPPNMIYPPVGDAFALRSKYAMAIDFKKEPPFFKVSDTHYAATWLLDPRAPKVEMPKIVRTRIENSLKAKKGGK
ncbi:MAG: ATP-binding cassette domain-containing protein [Bacilli bacterium]|nr:ATP-binding cassette domain-containing protein [Bacilli bacterium]